MAKHIITSILILVLCFSNGYSQPKDQQYKKQNRDRIAEIEDGETQEAIVHFKQYLAEYPEDLESMYGLSVAYTNKGEIGNAMKYVKMAVEHGLPVERFFAGPIALLEPLLESDSFKKYIRGRYQRLLHGPMLGKVTSNSAAIWIRTARPSNVEIRVMRGKKQEVYGDRYTRELDSRIQVEEYTPPSPDWERNYTGRSSLVDDRTVIVEITNLEADTDYRYEVYVDGSKYFNTGSFSTFPETGDALKLKVGFAGGAGYTPWNEHVWDTLNIHQLDAFFHMGDNVYIDHPEHPETQRYNYYRRQSRMEFRRFTSQLSNYAIWDDHDFTVNDGVGSPQTDDPAWKRKVWKVFKQQWINPSYGGGEEHPGIWFDVSIGDIDFFFLDGRYYREDPEEYGSPSMLGETQKQWLKDHLFNSEATFKVIVTPVPMTKGTKLSHPEDTWDGFPEEREELYSFIEDNQIEGILLLAADRHRSDAWKTKRTNGYDLYEFQSSKLTNWHTHPVMDGSLFGYNQKNSFGVVTFDTTKDDPQVSYAIYNIDNELIHQITIYKSQLVLSDF